VGYLEERANLPGKVAAVIGGGAGVGAAVTLALARAGVDVAFCDVKEEAVNATRGEVERLGRQVVTAITDALDVDQLRGFYATCDDTFDHLDILVNVVGGVRKREFSVTAPDQWSDDIHRNFGWVLHSTSLAIPRIRSSGRGGSIINFTTIEAHRGAAGYAAYAGAKAGLTNFSRALAVELGQEKIRVNLVAPDSTLSQQTKETMAASASAIGLRSPELMTRAFSVYVPLGAPPPPDDLGDAVLFLASELSASITGTTLHVDGGTWASSGFLRWPEPRGWGPTPDPRIFHTDGPGEGLAPQN
jgi:NAD(P)-dependent dehydrogenase (short-subunit alcohol dehydrogenase family)